MHILTHQQVESLLKGSPSDKQRLLAYWNALCGEHPPEREHKRPCLLGPPEAFSHEPAPAWYFDLWPEHEPDCMGPTSMAVTRRLASSCCGWSQRPTAPEFHDAIHAERPTFRQRCLISTWAEEASRLDVLDAWGERVYTIRELVTAYHKVEGLYTWSSFRHLNNMALVPEVDGIALWNC